MRMKEQYRVLRNLIYFAAYLITFCALPVFAVSAGTSVSGSFPAQSGKDVATIRYYTNADRTEYAFADFTYDAGSGTYSYSFSAPYDGFAASQASENVREEYTGNATVIAEYFNVNKWDGAVDVSWYDEESAEFYIDTPAKFAGFAAVVNGSVDCETKDYHIKGDQGFIECVVEDGSLPGGGTGPIHKAPVRHDFSDRKVILTADLDMGGTDGENINHYGNNDESNQYSYPNWMPVGGEYLADPADPETMVNASFNGILDGGGHHITNLYCYRYSYAGWHYAQGTGLIGSMGVLQKEETQPSVNPSIKNLSLSGYVYGRRMVGGIVGLCGGASNTMGESAANVITLENLASHVSVYNTDSKGIGGVVGTAYVKDGTIVNCYFDGLVSTTYGSTAGGIVGGNEHMNVFCCYCRGSIETSIYKHGRGIGGTGDSPSDFTVDSCYYLKGCGDDTDYPGYYTYNLPPSVSVNVTELTDTQMKNGMLLNGLNRNGNAYAAGTDGYPVLSWETGSGTGSLTVNDPDGGTVSASAEGALPNGTVVYLSCENHPGWNFRYFTVNDVQMTSDCVTVNGNTVVSAYMESSKAGTLRISHSPYVDITVMKNGTVFDGETFVNVTNAEVKAGDSIYEEDVLKVNAVLKSGVVPDDDSMDFSAAAGMANPFSYHFAYTGEDGTDSISPVFTVDSRINGDDVSLVLEVTALTTPKMWKSLADTSWYDSSRNTFTLTTAAQLGGLDVLVEEGNDFAGKTVVLGADISLKNNDGTAGLRSWDGIGAAGKAFAGTFDGGNHKITDLNGRGKGLFAYCAGSSSSNPASVKNVSVYGKSSGESACGIAALAKYTAISGCSSYINLEGSGSTSFTAGILGKDDGNCTIDKCFNYGSMTGVQKIGGIAGSLKSGSTVTDCFNYGKITVSDAGNNQVGGIAGEATGMLTRCANYGNIKASGRNIGGIAGQSTSSAAVYTDCCNVGEITCENSMSANDSMGGLVGFGSYYKLYNCYNYGTVKKISGTMETNIGSVIGRNNTYSANVLSRVYALENSCEAGRVITGSTIAELKAQNSSYYGSVYEANADDFSDPVKVLAAINGNDSFVLTNSRYPELKLAATSHKHTGGTATCVDRAVCTECGLRYGSLDPDHHTGTEIRNAKDAVWVYDGYTGDTCCPACGAVISAGEAIPADREKEAIRFVLKENGREDVTKVYTAGEFDQLKTTDPVICYRYGFKTRQAMAATEYVTLDDVFEDLGIQLKNVDSIKVISSGDTSTVTRETLTDCAYYFDEDGVRSDAPAAFAMNYATENGSPETIAAVAVPSNDLRFGYGISQKQFDDKEEMGGRRCVSPVKTVEINLVGSHIRISDYTAGSEDITNKTVLAEGRLITENMFFEGETVFEIDSEEAAVVAVKNADGSCSRLYVTLEEGHCRCRITVGEEDVELVVVLKGDSNLDGEVTSKDALFAAQIAAGIAAASAAEGLAADADSDETVTYEDAMLILDRVVDNIIFGWDQQ